MGQLPHLFNHDGQDLFCRVMAYGLRVHTPKRLRAKIFFCAFGDMTYDNSVLVHQQSSPKNNN